MSAPFSSTVQCLMSKTCTHGDDAMEDIIRTYIEGLKIGKKQFYKNLAMFPLLSTYDTRLDYLTLDEALSQGAIEVAEVSKEGHVPELRVINKSPRMVLILEGEELVGAKQNRIVNTTILVKGDSTLIIPVSCVEQGRWSYRSERFFSEDRMMVPSMRVMAAENISCCLDIGAGFQTNQSDIWGAVSSRARRRRAESPSMAMSEIYRKDRSLIGEYTNHFRLTEGQVGAVFMINGNVAGMDAFGKAETFSRVFKKVIESYSLDAIDWFNPEREVKVLKSKVTEFLKTAAASKVTGHQSVGLGLDIRIRSDKLIGFALTLDDKVVHLSAFVRAKGNGEENIRSRMQQFSRRRRSRIY